VDAETMEALRNLVGEEHGIPPSQRHRLTGSTVGQLRDDAKAMLRETGGSSPADEWPRHPATGQFVPSGSIYDERTGNDLINSAIRRAAGRA
jgi:hypothetical protein